MALPKFLQPLLPSYDISKMDLRDPEDRREIITQVLNFGDRKEISWLFKTYTTREIRYVIAHPKRGYWQERALNYWTRIFGIKVPKLIYEAAIFSLKHKPGLMERYFKYMERQK